jgi:hypothetical protein
MTVLGGPPTAAHRAITSSLLAMQAITAIQTGSAGPCSGIAKGGNVPSRSSERADDGCVRRELCARARMHPFGIGVSLC